MNREQAKQLLMAYEPQREAPEDPDLVEALRLARVDRELREWLDTQLAFHRNVRAQFRAIAPPPDLRESILARARVVVPLWRRPEILAAAACLALAFVISALWWTRSSDENTFAGFRSRMVDFAARTYRMDIETNDLAEVQRFLKTQGAPTDYALTPGLRKQPVKGGAYLRWQNNPVAMVCFDLLKKQTLYMFVLDETAIQGGNVPGPSPVLAQVRNMMTASWSQDGKVYVLAAELHAGALQRLISGVQARSALTSRLAAACSQQERLNRHCPYTCSCDEAASRNRFARFL